jgi:hypothetical protein
VEALSLVGVGSAMDALLLTELDVAFSLLGSSEPDAL